jgi:hypothetical protein
MEPDQHPLHRSFHLTSCHLAHSNLHRNRQETQRPHLLYFERAIPVSESPVSTPAAVPQVRSSPSIDVCSFCCTFRIGADTWSFWLS